MTKMERLEQSEARIKRDMERINMMKTIFEQTETLNGVAYGDVEAMLNETMVELCGYLQNIETGIAKEKSQSLAEQFMAEYIKEYGESDVR